MIVERGARAAVVAGAAALLAAVPAAPALAANGAMVAGDAATRQQADGWQVPVRDDCHDDKESCAYLDTSASGPDDVWAVGDGVDSGSGQRALVRHWDGEEWTTVEPAVEGSLRSVSTKSADETWLAGYRFTDTTVPLTLRWDGSELEEVDVPAGEGGTTLEGVSVGKDHPWLVGNGDDGDGTYTDLVWRWTGERWQQVDVPDLSPESGGLVDVAAPADDDVWVLGDQNDDGDHYVQHWDGTSWTRADLPDLEGSKTANDIQVANGEVYVVGDHTSAAEPYESTPFVQHLDGGTWRNFESPEYHGTATSLTRDGAGGFWLAGADYDDSTSRLHHWTGKRWTTTAGPDGDLASLTNVPGTTQLWASGGAGVDDEGFEAYVAEYRR